MKKIVYILTVLMIMSFTNDTFKSDQKKYSRVRQAYEEKESIVKSLLTENSIHPDNLRIYLRAFKYEKKLELWAKNKEDNQFKRIKVYEICNTSGKLGPKRKQGDRQIPEGFYHIDRFNPVSNFHLSLGINYPNKSDKILGVKTKLGGDIFIHGSCVTIGCIPIRDNWIKELYIFCVESKNSGQTKIPVTIFPAKLSESNFEKLKQKYADNNDKMKLWGELKTAYRIFNSTKKLPNIEFKSNGRHEIK